MAIIGTLPNNIQDGQLVDASPVMADFNFIVNQVNANANPVGTLAAPTGTRMVFQQAAAPTGWVTDATITDHTLWVTGGGGSTGGANPYSSMFGSSTWNTGSTAITIAQMPSHNHTDSGHFHSINPHSHGSPDGSAFMTYNTSGGAILQAQNGTPIQINAQSAQTQSLGLNSNTGSANIQNNGGGQGHIHTQSFNAQFAQCLIAQKS